MKKFFKTFLITNLSLLIALLLIIAPIQNSQHPINPLGDLTGQDKDTN